MHSGTQYLHPRYKVFSLSLGNRPVFHVPNMSPEIEHFDVWQDMKDLVKKILVLNPAHRLGVLKGGATDVKEHPWFANFDWKSFAAGTMRAPYVPKVTSRPSSPLCMLLTEPAAVSA